MKENILNFMYLKVVLGLIFFIIYLNRILYLSAGRLISLADDTPIVYTVNTWADLNIFDLFSHN